MFTLNTENFIYFRNIIYIEVRKMMRVEFERLIGEEVTDEEWELVELVYNLHPRDFNKQEVAQLWKLGGREAFEGLRPLAEKVRNLENERWILENELKKIKRKIDNIDAELRELRVVHGRKREGKMEED